MMPFPSASFGIAEAVATLHSQLTGCPNAVSQAAFERALQQEPPEVERMAAEFDRRRRLIVGGLNALPGVSCVMPKGAFYAFANVSGLLGRVWTHDGTALTLKSSVDAAAFLLEQARVAVVPGLDFGSDAHVRLSYATSEALIREGLARMSAAIKTLG